MKKLLLTIVLLFSISTSAFAVDYDYGYYGVTTDNKVAPVLWAEYPQKKASWVNITVEADGPYVLRQYNNKSKIISQKVYKVGQQISLENSVAGIQLQLISTGGTFARLTNGTSTNKLADNVIFYPEPF